MRTNKCSGVECPNNASCEESTGTCACHPGYVLNGHSCVLVSSSDVLRINIDGKEHEGTNEDNKHDDDDHSWHDDDHSWHDDDDGKDNVEYKLRTFKSGDTLKVYLCSNKGFSASNGLKYKLDRWYYGWEIGQDYSKEPCSSGSKEGIIHSYRITKSGIYKFSFRCENGDGCSATIPYTVTSR
ncbi:MAG: hypothetical protein KTR25_19460 [Myxococcales bacterium]|nr:hypothetical protein [Myxococcales bacterium]